MSEPVVARLTADDAELVRDLRIELLDAYPENFAADPDFEGGLSLDEWRQRLSADARHWFLCRVDGEIAGMIVFSRITHTRKRRHLGDIGSMYVRERFHGAGVADALMNAVLDVARGAVEQITLTVNAENERAIGFYKRHGFREYGCQPRALKVGARYYDELAMQRVM